MPSSRREFAIDHIFCPTFDVVSAISVSSNILRHDQGVIHFAQYALIFAAEQLVEPA